MICYWCGRQNPRIACAVCREAQGIEGDRIYAPEHDDGFQPSITYVHAIGKLRAYLAACGIPPIDFAPDEPEWLALNVERFLLELEQRTALAPP